MSRIGKQPIPLPAGVELTTSATDVSVKGPKGSLQLQAHPHVLIKNADGVLTVEVENPDVKEQRALWGLYRALLANMVKGVTQGFERKLEINGVGYRASTSGNKVVLNIGFSHPVEITIPEGVSVAVEKNVVTISGSDKQVVGQLAAVIRAQKPPEPYKGKGIKYDNETVRRKAGKAAKAGA